MNHSTPTLSPQTPVLLATALLALASLTALACTDLEPIDESSAPAASPASTNSAPPAAPSAPSAPARSPAPAGEGVVDARGLLLTLPEGWQEVTPDSAMRAAQFALPGDGRLAVFHFGVGGGGGVEANLNRWVGQMAGASEPSRDAFQNQSGLAVTTVEVTGTLSKSGIGSFPTEDMPGYRLIGAVVEGPGGPWYLRAVGPEAALASERERLRTMLDSAAASGG